MYSVCVCLIDVDEPPVVNPPPILSGKVTVAIHSCSAALAIPFAATPEA